MAIEIRSLKFYPNLNCAITDAYRTHIYNSLVRNCTYEALAETIHKGYACFLHVISGHTNKFDGLIELNDHNSRITHIKRYIGFCLHELESSYYSAFAHARYIFSAIVGESLVSLSSFPVKKADIPECIALYNQCKNTDLVNYYAGWECTSLDNVKIRLHLAFLYDATNKDFVDFVHHACSNYFRKHNSPYALSGTRKLIETFKQLVAIYKDPDSIILSISPENVSNSFENILHLDLLEVKLKTNSNALRNLIRNHYPSKVMLYKEIFVESKLIDEPIRKIVVPTLKSLKNSNKSISSGGGLTKETVVRLTSGIPLDIPNQQAFDIIQNRLRHDILHIKNHSLCLVHKVLNKDKAINSAITTGQIKPPPSHGSNLNGGYKGAENYPYGRNNIVNTIATFYHYGFKGVRGYISFLSSKDNELSNDELVKELNLPTHETIYPFLLLLVHEHPQLVPSSFQDWDLFDTDGRLVGFKETNGVMVISTFKERRGKTKSALILPCTRLSKLIVAMLIEHTKYCREYLRSIGDDNWRKLLLVTSSINKKPVPIKLVRRDHNYYGSLFKNFEKSISKVKGTWVLKNNENYNTYVSLRALRSTIAVSKYIETSSLDIFHETLGHTKSYYELVNAYLPDVLQKYVQERDIRIFQNTVIYLSMKDSPYLLEVLDANIVDADDFFTRHGFDVDNLSLNSKRNNIYDSLEILISVPLLQIMIYIITLDDFSIAKLDINPLTLEKWKTLSSYVITHIESSINNLTKFKVNKHVIDAYNVASNHKLTNLILR
ncbi:hypothetical protein C1N32_20305 [Vibrio diazotrophicus]|jgi:hypothetical protein|uniref:Uncharacterized protein n=1 Tax=Vibrio diazotrophicus TaxID=685 RepID=A0A2J8HTE5_VIBDI|nr:hypothetical protein [Vibrio diazotrophicus]PNI01548.1 hypothetical protein C1N32_20305 [Vibrio diazotrophicus]RAS62845.1 hypothetical protein DET48_113121 [Vibrio diazotrophicus]